jgi:hypothetical protein
VCTIAQITVQRESNIAGAREESNVASIAGLIPTTQPSIADISEEENNEVARSAGGSAH